MRLSYDILDKGTDILTAAKHWQVSPNGLVLHARCGERHPSGTPEYWEEMYLTAKREVEDCVSYLSEVSKIKSPCDVSSYGLKHEIERYYRDCLRRSESNYVCNGSAILALMFLGFPLWVASTCTPNVVPGMSAKRPWSWKARLAHKRNNK